MAGLWMALNEIVDKKFEEAAIWAEKAWVQNRRSVVVLRALIVAFVNTGRMDRARQFAKELLTIEPQFRISQWRAYAALVNEDLATTYADALRAVGIPE
jgi:hypothetical protein